MDTSRGGGGGREGSRKSFKRKFGLSAKAFAQP